MKLAIVVGTRPEIIKMSPIIKCCQANHVDFRIIYTRQHYSKDMSSVFFDELELPVPHYTLESSSGSHGTQLGTMLMEFEKVFAKESFDFVLVQGDTNSVLAGALIASRHSIPVGHVEAGLRSRDRTMPEEINRIAVDQIADLLFAPSDTSLNNLFQEGVSKERAWNTGNTIVDATLQGVELAKKKKVASQVPNQKDYLLLTLHRPANVDKPGVLKEILEGIKEVMRHFSLSAVLPVHPRTKKQINDYQLSLPEGLKVIDPAGYLDFLLLQANARLIMTDSGGVQEEACILHVPCVTLRENTERPETVAIGANMLGGVLKENIIQAAHSMMHAPLDWAIPYGNGTSAQQIMDKVTANA